MKKSNRTNATGAKDDGDVIPSVSTNRSKTIDEGSIDCSLECIHYETGHGLSRYKNALENLVPVRPRDKEKAVSPVDSAGLFSSIFFTWISPFMSKAYREGIAIDELPKASPYDTCEYNRQRMETLWNLELSRRGPEKASFKRVAWQFVRTRIYASCFLFTCTLVLGFLSPTLLMRRLLLNVQSPDGTIADSVIFALLLTTTDLLRALFFAWTWATNYRTALRLRSACMALLYGKILGSNGIGGKSVGELINVFSNDCQRVFDVILVGPMIIGGPVVAALGICYILWLLSPLALSGMLVFFLFYPLQYIISRLIGHFRSRSVKVTDARIRTMSEILECAKLIKMSAWEEYFSRKLLDIRRREQELLLKVAYCRSLGMSLAQAVPVISAIVTFLAHLSSGSSLTAAEAFPVSTFFGNQMKQALTSIRDSTQNLIDAFIAFDRFKSILLLKEGERYMQRPIVKFQSIAINRGTFARDYSDDPVARSETGTRVPNGHERQMEETISLQTGERADRLVEVLFEISFEAKKGELIGICGHVGSGKSSLLLAILGQLRTTTGCVARDGSCAYASQQAWIVNGTFRENILFGERFDARRYHETLMACSLNRDLDALPEGELTEIGERGANLSGGQKQRVALARALYANRDIYLLDDPLSAVDAQVGARVFHDSILTFLREKTIVFVTHSIKYLSRCDVVCMMREGRIAMRGTHEELAQADGEYAAMVNIAAALDKTDDPSAESENSRGDSYPGTSGSRRHDESRQNSRDNCDATVAAGIAANLGGDEKMISPVSRASVQRLGAVKSETYRTYIRAAGGYFAAIAVLATFLLNVGSTTFSTWWLAAWLNAGAGDANTDTANDDGITTTAASGGIGDNPDFGYYRTVYGLCIGAILVTSLIRGFGITRATLEAATALHNGVFEKVMSCPVRFFDTTPSGRIQNLFSRDFDEVDNRLPLTLEGTIQNTCIMLFAVLSICVVFPWFGLPLIFLAALYYSIGRIFRVAIRDLRRLENESRSPIFSFVSVTVQGLSTIRAFEKEGNFAIKFQDLLNRNNSCLFLCNVAMRWLAIRFDCLAVVLTCITAFLVTFLKGRVSPALAGLALSYCAYIAGVFQYTVRLMAEVEMRFTSVEKIENYTKSLKSEKRVTSEKLEENEAPQNDWPSLGRIEFKDVRMRYGEGLPLALNGISFKVERGEKIGIVGRTGSGKSSLIAALFGLVDLDGGKIEIDGVDVSRIDRKVLRSRLSVIPQDPVLFTGTVRSNLDPSGARADSEVWEALEKTRSKDKVLSMAARLDSPIGFSGNDLSQGERQLLCLTRALLRCSKILVLDEATAAVDPETEEAVQNTIQREFANCTVLTIAHRLRAVLDSDRVLVMDAAKVLEFDTPANLLADESSKFSKMMAAAR